ncbi:kinase-like domain-containing protein [Radiomyces spectabilis]|uniref:kinase-like domain-containing protein n=1 Tax=Radiomyces spectabilis TaxID=64574 RepID=UPI00221E42DF|nr:kinase-like domain-containing protein [Radiomyces spectabilis]KAI8394279.1 kinase-like domain-containing protein [Radiomyces spectabilis]
MRFDWLISASRLLENEFQSYIAPNDDAQTCRFKNFNDAFEHFERDTSAQYELHPKYGRYVWDIGDQWYQKWNVVFSLEHMWNWTPRQKHTSTNHPSLSTTTSPSSSTTKSSNDNHEEPTTPTPPERPLTVSSIQPWLDFITLRHHIRPDHRQLLDKICNYLVRWHQTNRPLALVGACKLNTVPFFPPSWFVDKQLKNHGDNEGLAPSYIARFVPPYRLTHAAVPERWDVVFLKGLTEDPDHQFDIDPGLIVSSIMIYGLTVHYDDKTGYSQLMMVMKKATYGNLETSLEKEIPEDYAKPRRLALSITKGLKDLHWEYVHGNVHPRNILLNFADYVGELVDITFMQRNRSIKKRHMSCHGGGRWPYVAPEVASTHTRLSTAADVYALGIILWQLISRVTFPDNVLVDPYVYRIEPIPGVMKEWEDLYTDCLNTDPSKRPNAYTVYRRLEKMPSNVKFERSTLDYIQQRRLEIQKFLSEQHRQFADESNTSNQMPRLAQVGDHVLTASVTRLVNQQLESYPTLVQKFSF